MVSKEWIEDNYVRGDVTFAELMEVLGMTKSGTYRHLRKLGVVKRPTRSRVMADRATLERLYITELLSVEEIATHLGCSLSSVKDACSAWGLKRGSGYKRTERGRERYSKPHSPGAKLKMSKAKTKLNGEYHRGKFGTTERRYVHRRIAEETIGRKLEIDEVVHHIDQDRQNNRPENLIVLTREAHTALHIVMRHRPGLDQSGWLGENGFEFMEVKNGKYLESATYQRWYGEKRSGEPLGAN